MTLKTDLGGTLPIGSHHYRAYVGPPEKYDLVAAVQFNLLTCLGLREFHFLLDIGCGSLRAGRLFIPYLLPGHYFGIEPEQWLIEEGIKNELGADILRAKRPVFSHDLDFDCTKFNQKFDFILAQSIFSHASASQIRKCLSEVEKCMQPGGIIAATFVKGTEDYRADTWVYPDCVSYTLEYMMQLAAEVGLTAEPVDWPHPNGQTWIRVTRRGTERTGHRVPVDAKESSLEKVSIAATTIKKPAPICIIGMHRSGTSMIARLLERCGLYLGSSEQMEGPDESNVFGHFEHKGFLEINDALLVHFGGSWVNPPNLRSGWESDPSLGELVRRAELLVETFHGRPFWGWKEPRTTILLPFWKSIIPNLRVVICVRSPLDVAMSLAKRDGMPLSAGGYLWNWYMRTAVRDTRAHPRIFTFYEDYFANPVSEISKLVDFCGLPRPAEMFHVQDAIAHEVRHHTSETLELMDSRELAIEYRMFYIGLRALLFQQFSFSPPCNDGRDTTSENIDAFLRLIDEMHSQQEIACLQAAVAEKNLQTSSVQVVLQGNLKKKEIQLKEQAIQFQDQVSHLQEQNAKLQAFSDEVRRTLAYRFYRNFIRPLKSRWRFW